MTLNAHMLFAQVDCLLDWGFAHVLEHTHAATLHLTLADLKLFLDNRNRCLLPIGTLPDRTLRVALQDQFFFGQRQCSFIVGAPTRGLPP